MNVSRRGLLRGLPAIAAGAPLVISLDAQEPRRTAAGADRELENARLAMRASALAVRQVPLAMAIEPALHFVPRS